MGNRAVLSFSSSPSAIGVYLHWHGSPETVESILATCRKRKYRTPSTDPIYAMARLIGACHELTGVENSVSLGVCRLSELDTESDNGLYIIGGDWRVTNR